MLSLLLDEHISPRVAKGLRRLHGKLTVHAMAEWETGAFLCQPDPLILREAFTQNLTLVTYDQKTIRPLLRDWIHEGRPHGGVIFVDDKTIAPEDIGGLVRALAALAALAAQRQNDDWRNRVLFLQR
jgi:hypothetical protein